MLRRSLVCLAALAVLASACVPPEDDSILDDYVDDRIVREIRRVGRITIAIDDSIGILGAAEEASAPVGFAVDVGTAIADELGVEAEFVRVSEDDLATIAAGKVRAFNADALFVYEPMTEKLLRSYTLSDPYLVSHQRLLVRSDAGVDGIDDLAGGAVCQIIDPDTGVSLDRLVDVRATDGSARSCRQGIDSSTPITATELVLYDVMAAHGGDLRIVGDDLTTEGYGVFVESGASGFASFVSAVIQGAIEDGEWSRWYDRWIGKLDAGPPEPPDLTAEEAAALFPSDQPLSR